MLPIANRIAIEAVENLKQQPWLVITCNHRGHNNHKLAEEVAELMTEWGYTVTEIKGPHIIVGRGYN